MRARLLMFLCAIVVVGCQEKKRESGIATIDTITTNAFPPTPPLVGVIRGKPFIPERVELDARRLTFAKGEGPGMVGFVFELPKTNDTTYAGKEWTFFGNNRADPLIDLRSADDQGVNTSDMIWGTDYTMKLKIMGQSAIAISGTIDLRIRNAAGTYLVGKFTATMTKAASDLLDANNAPYVQGAVEFVGGWKDENLQVGFVGRDEDGKAHVNSIGFRVLAGFDATSVSRTFEPQVTRLLVDGAAMPTFRHTKLAPGEYVFYARCNHVLIGWKKVQVKAGDQQTVDFTIDPTKMGDLNVTLPDAEANAKNDPPLLLIPDGLTLPPGTRDDSLFYAGESAPGEKMRKIKRVPAGKYTVKLGKSMGSVEVLAGKEATVTLK